MTARLFEEGDFARQAPERLSLNHLWVTSMANAKSPEPADMKVLLLAAGYGTRLGREIVADGRFVHLVGLPKPLLPIGELPLLTRWVNALDDAPLVQGIYVVVGLLSTTSLTLDRRFF